MAKIDHLQTVKQFKTYLKSMVKYYLYKMHTGENFMHTLKKQTAWLLEKTHGQIIKRTGNTYYEITK